MTTILQTLRTRDGRRIEVQAGVVDDVITVVIDDAAPVQAQFRRLPDGGIRVDLPTGGRTVFSQVQSRSVHVSLGGRTVEFERLEAHAGGDDDAGDSDLAAAPMPGKVVEVHVQPGDRVNAGDALVVLEAMKLNNSVEAPRAGVVQSVAVAVGDQVGPGDPLVRLAAVEEE